MKPLIHARISARKYGGVVEDYLAIHDFFDSTKAALADVRHRAVLHSAFGIFIAERVFGTYITNSENKQVSVRDIGEDHVIDDLGFIPTLEHWLKDLPIAGWMGGPKRAKRESKALDDVADGEAPAPPQLPDHPTAPIPPLLADLRPYSTPPYFYCTIATD